MSVRLRRLRSEHERLKVVFDGHDRIRIVEATGRPPERYVVEFTVKGLVEENGELVERNTHRAEITLGPDYPKQMPRCVMLTPVFHPNIDHLAICTEDIGSAGQTLDQTIIFIAEMISFQAYNLQSPRNGDAAHWTKENENRLPLETIDLFPPVLMDPATQRTIAWRTASQSAELEQESSQDRSREPSQDRSQDRSAQCVNCGSPTAAAALCAAGHPTCADCAIECANCGTSICLECGPGRCRVCTALVRTSLFCRDCLVPCSGCGSVTCLEHAAEACVVCSGAATRTFGQAV
jgi:ubiquitin-protein ligase